MRNRIRSDDGQTDGQREFQPVDSIYVRGRVKTCNTYGRHWLPRMEKISLSLQHHKKNGGKLYIRKMHQRTNILEKRHLCLESIYEVDIIVWSR